MSDSAGLHAKGAKISLSTTSGGSYTAIGEIVSYEPGPLEIPAASATHLLSVATEKKPALPNATPIKLTINYVQAQYSTLLGYLGAMIFMKETMPQTAAQSTVGDVWLSEGFFSKIPMGPDKVDPLDTKVMQATFEFVVTGLPTFTAGS